MNGQSLRAREPAARRGGLRGRRLLLALALALGVVPTLGVGNALAFNCSTAAGVTTVALNPGESVVLRVGAGDQLTANGFACGGTTSTVNSVVVFGTNAGSETVTIDESAGRFEPGLTTGEAGISEIEFFVALGDTTGDADTLVVNDIQTAGAVRIGEDGGGSTFDGAAPGVVPPLGLGFLTAPTPGGNLLNLNAFPADNDADLLDAGTNGESIEAITVNGQGGNDDLSAKGGDGTGATTGQACIVASPGPPPVFADDESPAITLNGGAGDDFLQGGECGDLLIGGPGQDQIQGNLEPGAAVCAENERLGAYQAVPGLDVADFSDETGPLTIVFNADGTLTVTDASGARDFISGAEGVIGSPGNDTITGNAGNNFIAGGAGDDTLRGGLGNDCVFGGPGNDVLDESYPTAPDGTPTYGPSGNGADALDGGPGEDTVDYSARQTRTVVNLGVISWFNDGADPNADSVSNECDDVFFTTENAITGSGNDILSADYLNNQSDNELTGGAGNDQLEGGAGNDVFHEGSAASGADAMEGDAGLDTADYSQRTNPVLVSLDGASNDGEAGEGDNVGASVRNAGPAGCVAGQVYPVVEAIPGGGAAFVGQSEPAAGNEAEDTGTANEMENVTGGSGNDVLVGNDQSNVLVGNAGNDTLSGEGGADVLNGGDGDDTLAGGAGNDQLTGGGGTNTADFGSASSGVNVNLTTNTVNGEGNDVLSGIANVNGSRFNDSINGDANANVINGRAGNDTINGRGGDDTVNGGAGGDELNGNGGNDRVNGGSGNDAVRGEGGDDNLQGGPGNDFLGGGAGNDVLAGNAGNDTHRGGPGTDRCVPGSPGLGRGDTASGCER